MNTKLFIILISVIVFFSCNRELASLRPKSAEAPLLVAHALPENNEILSSSVKEGSYSEEFSGEKDSFLPVEKRSYAGKKKETILRKLAQKNILKKEVRQKIREQKQIKKEMDPRLSRALWMTIFGGIATTLGIVFMAYAPTGLFVFAFGLVFLIGVITLIMYLANPKPKM